MRSFEYYTPTKVIFGKDTHLKIGELLKDYNCHKVLIHYGSESAVKSGLIHEISKCLTEAGIDFVTLGGVVPNPRTRRYLTLSERICGFHSGCRWWKCY
jgi:alcohol dehydrogenase YqhD (iron-dependent ADH family)